MGSPSPLAQADRPLPPSARTDRAHSPSARADGLLDALYRGTWREVLRWHARLFLRRRLESVVLETVEDSTLVVLPDVFNPVVFRTGAFLVRQVAAGRLIPIGASVLDMGTGSGVGAVVAARRAGLVVAVDVNPAAVRCARINTLLNHVEERVEVRRGDLFAPVDAERFDVVLFNPPFFRGAPRDAFDLAWRSVDVVERFAAGLADHLSPHGCAYVVLSSDGDRERFLHTFRTYGLGVDVVAEEDLVNERLMVYRLLPARRVE